MIGLESSHALPVAGYSVACLILLLVAIQVAFTWRATGDWIVSAAGVACATTALACAANALAIDRPEWSDVASVLSQAHVAGWLLWLAAVHFRDERRSFGLASLMLLVLIGLTPALPGLLTLAPTATPITMLRLALAVGGLVVVGLLWRVPTSAGERAIRLLVRLAGILLVIEALVASFGLYAPAADLAGANSWRGGALAMVGAGIVAAASARPDGTIHSAGRVYAVAIALALVVLLLLGGLTTLADGLKGIDARTASALAAIVAVAGLVIAITRPDAAVPKLAAVAQSPAAAKSLPLDTEPRLARFLDRLTVDDASGRSEMPDRLLQAMMEALQASGGALWHRSAPERYRLLASHAIVPPPTAINDAPGLAADLRQLDRPIDAADLQGTDSRLWPRWLPDAISGRLLLPLIHRGTLNGLMIIDRPSTGRLSGSEPALLHRLGRQAAACLAEDQLVKALAESRQFSDLTRRFAFVAHDLKNLKAELCLAAENAVKYRGNMEFYDDLQATIAGSADKLKRVLNSLREEVPPVIDEVDLRELIAGVTATKRDRRPVVVAGRRPVRSRVDRARLSQALRHLVDNAFDAAGDRGKVELSLVAKGDQASIEVTDDGPGMSQEFLSNWLFRPFATTKQDGLGLGLVEARQIVESLGGRLAAESASGHGTKMRIILPCIATA